MLFIQYKLIPKGDPLAGLCREKGNAVLATGVHTCQAKPDPGRKNTLWYAPSFAWVYPENMQPQGFILKNHVCFGPVWHLHCLADDVILTIHEVKCLFVEGKSALECGGGSGGPGRKNLNSSWHLWVN